ncbi:hypothetical protein GCM10011511_50390 [Puia dinghuensis]|uniref:HTH araC/xylS-type domain-containing protein n=1 Tax=Puia dinghuensis TaxID=1792502 RepID=A0A8J2UHY5_9BACT|nr:hypothetical protein GCM10011511_50390 [Puia dinghuensis]
MLCCFIETNKPFLRQRYRIDELSRDVGIPSYQLSAFINTVLGCNFNDYINKMRVIHCEELMRQQDIDQFNIYGLAFECGFHNRNSFTVAFKKFTGYTPSFYLKLVRSSLCMEQAALTTLS